MSTLSRTSSTGRVGALPQPRQTAWEAQTQDALRGIQGKAMVGRTDFPLVWSGHRMGPGEPERRAPRRGAVEEFDLEEFGLFVSADGIRSSAPWRLKDYGRDGALSEDQTQALAGQFDLDARELRGLSVSLGLSLNSEPSFNFVQVRRSKARARANKEIVRALAEVTAAHARLAAAGERLAPLYADAIQDPEGAARFHEARDQLERCETEINALRHTLEAVAKAPRSVLVLDPTDKRHVVDERRRHVLRNIFHF